MLRQLHAFPGPHPKSDPKQPLRCLSGDKEKAGLAFVAIPITKATGVVNMPNNNSPGIKGPRASARSPAMTMIPIADSHEIPPNARPVIQHPRCHFSEVERSG